MNSQAKSSAALGLLYAVVIFLSAFLLFQVQPLIGKFILPWFGGTPAVWTNCMLVFQLLLFGGYAYAHLTNRFLGPRAQVAVHVLLLLVALASLPITPDASWKPSGDQSPAARIVLLLLCTIGLPYFVLSSTSPLIQAWFSRTHPGQSPYRLYSLSNVGSLLALLTYPFVFEPWLASDAQSQWWSGLFALFAALCAVGAGAMLAVRPQPLAASGELAAGGPASRGPATRGQAGGRSTSAAVRAQRPRWDALGMWFGLAMAASTMLLATTNQVCLDVAVVPFLWVVPLALYLVTFILCFESDRWYRRREYAVLAVGLLFASMMLVGRGSNVPIMLQVGVFFSMLFCCCMVCHGELARLRPDPRHLTTYFLTISAGGAAGGVLVGLLAPLMFVAYNELHFGVFLCLFLFVCLRLREDGVRLPLPAWASPLAVGLLFVAVLGALVAIGHADSNAVAVKRNFYGVLKVCGGIVEETDEKLLRLAHGRITHGIQFVSSEKRRTPTSYYATCTGIGQVMRQLEQQPSRHIGVVGLGTGTMAAYAGPADRLRLYEINPQVVELAREHFTFLRDCPAEQQIVLGDARLSLEFESPQAFDVLVLDAFSGDAIPVHLLTQEALDVYLKHLAPDGILACHISNLHFNLQPVIQGLADSRQLAVVIRRNQAAPESAALASIWAVMARTPERLAEVTQTVEDPRPVGHPILWTDNRSNLLEVLW